MNNSISKTIAIIAMVLQVAIPTWWASIIASFYYFWVEAIIEGGIFGSDELLFSILWGLFSIYSIVAIVVSIYSLFSTRRAVFFLIVNLLTIILVGVVVSLNGGIIPRF
jgi:hypothetical protein